MNNGMKKYLKALGYKVERVAIGWQAYDGFGNPLFSYPKLLDAAWKGVVTKISRTVDSA